MGKRGTERKLEVGNNLPILLRTVFKFKMSGFGRGIERQRQVAEQKLRELLNSSCNFNPNIIEAIELVISELARANSNPGHATYSHEFRSALYQLATSYRQTLQSAAKLAGVCCNADEVPMTIDAMQSEKARLNGMLIREQQRNLILEAENNKLKMHVAGLEAQLAMHMQHPPSDEPKLEDLFKLEM